MPWYNMYSDWQAGPPSDEDGYIVGEQITEHYHHRRRNGDGNRGTTSAQSPSTRFRNWWPNFGNYRQTHSWEGGQPWGVAPGYGRYQGEAITDYVHHGLRDYDEEPERSTTRNDGPTPGWGGSAGSTSRRGRSRRSQRRQTSLVQVPGSTQSSILGAQLDGEYTRPVSLPSAPSAPAPPPPRPRRFGPCYEIDAFGQPIPSNNWSVVEARPSRRSRSNTSDDTTSTIGLGRVYATTVGDDGMLLDRHAEDNYGGSVDWSDLDPQFSRSGYYNYH